MTSGTTSQVVSWLEGTASKVDPTGFLLVVEGRPPRRYSISRYASPRPIMPAEGQQVRVGLDKAGYVRAVEPLDAAATEPPSPPMAPPPARQPSPRPDSRPVPFEPDPPLPTDEEVEMPEDGDDDLLDAFPAEPESETGLPAAVVEYPSSRRAPTRAVSEPEPVPVFSARKAPNRTTPQGTTAPIPSVPPAVDGGAQPLPQRSTRDVVVTRLACLNTAVAILSSGARVVEPDEVLDVAVQLERWATRPREA